MLAGSIHTNVSALFALNSLSNTSNKTSSLEQQLSSGLAINSPADNPAGFIAAQGFQTQITTISQQTQFNNQNLLDGSFQGVQFQTGPNAGQTIQLSIANTAPTAVE